MNLIPLDFKKSMHPIGKFNQFVFQNFVLKIYWLHFLKNPQDCHRPLFIFEKN